MLLALNYICSPKAFKQTRDPIKFNYTIHDYSLESVEEAKYLYLTIRTRFKMENHVNNVYAKTNETLGIKMPHLSY